MVWFRKLHKWIGIVIGLQITLWMVSGLMMGLLHHDDVQGISTRNFIEPAPLQGTPIVEPAIIRDQLDASVSAINLVTVLDRQAYRVASDDGIALFDARSGQQFAITESYAREIAVRDYAGEGEVGNVSAVEAPMIEIRKHSGPAWRVDFSDEAETSIYVSAQDGRILERRNSTWRLFDIFWMLHIMDYQEREDFNNALVIIVGLFAALFAVTGVTLLFDSFGKEDFLALLPSGLGLGRTEIAVHGPAGEVISRLSATNGQRLYDALSAGGLVLPSNCGGGGTCGLCEVNLGPNAPLCDSDKRVLPADRRDAGARLSCQARVASNMAVTVSRESLEAKRHRATVTSSRCVTPFIREIKLQLADPSFNYRAGSYIHAIIPPHRFTLEDLDVPYEFRRYWGGDAATLESDCREEVRRAYSLALPAAESQGTLVLNVRLMLPAENVINAPAGAGSAWMWNLRPGDSVDFVGPLGEFHAEPSEADMIVIGGGAGMAPLRAIIRDQLLQSKSRRRIDFWYGARTKSDLFYADEMDELQARFQNFRWQPVLSSPALSDEWSSAIGFVHAAAHEGLLKDRSDLEDCEFFLCGPPAMLEATRRLLRELGVPDRKVKFDDFGI
jgi:Na+-transporting NADH:ubiquinone oxidoreductase subunit F